MCLGPLAHLKYITQAAKVNPGMVTGLDLLE